MVTTARKPLYLDDCTKSSSKLGFARVYVLFILSAQVPRLVLGRDHLVRFHLRGFTEDMLLL